MQFKSMIVPRVQERYHLLLRLNFVKQGLLRKQKTAGTRWLQIFLQNANSNTKYYSNEETSTEKDKVIYLSVSEYSSVVPDFAKGGVMDGKYYRETDLIQI